jgi:preprotein translocase subunit SecD
MKLFRRFVLFVVILCVLAGAAWGGYWLYRRYTPPGGQGRNMEVRLVALNGAAPATDVGLGIDTFRADDVQAYIQSGQAPAGWKWLPVANGAERDITGSAPAGAQNPYVTRTGNGNMYLLVADRPDTTLTHRSDGHPWGVDSVKIETDGLGPAVGIRLDQAGGDLMYQFTRKYLGHRIAVVVSGQICEVALIEDPVRRSIEVRLPTGQEAEAESLRDSLMK